MSEQLRGILTVGQVATRLGVQTWQVVRMFERKLLPEPPRLGRARVIREEDVPAIAEALRKGGYLK
jgi:hypothetical protein